ARDSRRRCASSMRRLTSQHLIRDSTERVDVTPSIYYSITGRLLGTHVLRRAERKPRLRNSITASLADSECNSEISDYRLPSLKQNVLRLQIPMNDSMRVSVIESVCNRDSHSDCFVNWKLLFTSETRS